MFRNCNFTRYYSTTLSGGVSSGVLDSHQDYPQGLVGGFGSKVFTDKKRISGADIYDYSILPQCFAPLRPLIEQTLRCDDKKPKLTSRAQLLLRNFKFDRIFIEDIPCIEDADVQTLSETTEAYQNAVPVNLRSRFLDRSSSVGYILVTLILADDDSLDSMYKGSVRVSWDKVIRAGWNNKLRMYKNSAIAAPILADILAPVVTSVSAFVQAFDGLVDFDDRGRIDLSHAGLPSSSDGSVNGQYLLVSDSYRCPSFHPNLTVVGSDEDFARLDTYCDALQIQRCPEDQRFVPDAALLENKKGEATYNQILNLTGSEKSAVDYGCLMYLAWLASQAFYFKTWRRAGAMTDWLNVLTDKDVTNLLNKFDTYAAYKVDGRWVLATSCGFVEITDGDLAEPKVAMWQELETYLSMAGLSKDEVKNSYEESKKAGTDYGYSYRNDKAPNIATIVTNGTKYQHCVLQKRSIDEVRGMGNWLYEKSMSDTLDELVRTITTKSFSSTSYSYNSGDGSASITQHIIRCIISVMEYLQNNATEIKTFATPLTRKAGVISYDMSQVNAQTESVVMLDKYVPAPVV